MLHTVQEKYTRKICERLVTLSDNGTYQYIKQQGWKS